LHLSVAVVYKTQNWYLQSLHTVLHVNDDSVFTTDDTILHTVYTTYFKQSNKFRKLQKQLTVYQSNALVAKTDGEIQFHTVKHSVASLYIKTYGACVLFLISSCAVFD